MIVTSNRGPTSGSPPSPIPMRAQSAIDRFTSNAYDLVIEGESYRTPAQAQALDERKLIGHAHHRYGEHKRGGHPLALPKDRTLNSPRR